MKVNEAIKEMLTQRNITQSEAARRLGKSRGVVSMQVLGNYYSLGDNIGMTCNVLLDYANMLGYSLVLAPKEGGIPIPIDTKTE